MGALAACVPASLQPPPPGRDGAAAAGDPRGVTPQPVTEYCAGSVPSNASAYQAAFDNLRRTYTEWASVDGAVPVPIDSGRVLWLFGDTYIGKVSETGEITPSDALVNNSFVLQTGACFKPLMGGTPLARTDRIPSPAAGEFYWPASGIMDNGAIQIFMLLVDQGTPPHNVDRSEWVRDHCSYTCRQIKGMSVATLSTSSLTIQGVTAALPWAPTRPIGQSNFSEGTYVYFYGSYNAGESDHAGSPEQRHYVARAPVGQVKRIEAWEYWDGTGFQASIDSAQPMTFQPGTPNVNGYDLDGPAGGCTVTAAPPGAVGYSYLGTAKLLDGFSDDVSVFTATNPWGPWSYKARVANTDFPGLSTYSAFTHLALPGTSSPIVAFSTNDQLLDSTDQLTNIGVYGPRFVSPLAGALP